MAQITTLQSYGLPGRTRSFSPKVESVPNLPDNMHIFSTTVIEPVYAPDNAGSILVQDSIEAQGSLYAGNGFSGTFTDHTGKTVTVVAGIITSVV